ncbi:hypothetical protein [Sinorhizobium meliloti]|uniref:hypothetical protein n=1 Tax=Rhizobium meliloti TaxID=382 RepID=UPI001F3F7594|nr:hypothetical protein [Sinorhizobium meliloti]
MAHEETADLLRSARPKFLQNSISRREKKNRNRIFQKFRLETYPFRGWPQKQAVVYTSDIKREWFGRLKDATNHHSRPTQRCGISAASLERFACKPVNCVPSPAPNYSKRVGTPFDIIPLLIREVDAATVWRLQTVRQYRMKLIAWTSDE